MRCKLSSTESVEPPVLLPAAGTSAVWKYKANYRFNDEQVGQCSDVVGISVMS